MSMIKKQTATSEVSAQEAPMLTPEEFVEQLRALRNRLPEFVQLPDTRLTQHIRRTSRMNVDFAREAFNAIGVSPVVQDAIGNTPGELHEATDEATRWTSTESEIEALLRGVAAANVIRRQRIARAALQAYNVSRELVKHEEHQQLLPYVKRMKRLPKFGRRAGRAAAEPQPPTAQQS
jgi:hypothetical protein